MTRLDVQRGRGVGGVGLPFSSEERVGGEECEGETRRGGAAIRI